MFYSLRVSASPPFFIAMTHLSSVCVLKRDIKKLYWFNLISQKISLMNKIKSSFCPISLSLMIMSTVLLLLTCALMSRCSNYSPNNTVYQGMRWNEVTSYQCHVVFFFKLRHCPHVNLLTIFGFHYQVCVTV